MSAEYAQALCLAVARRDFTDAKAKALMLAAKLAPARHLRITREFERQGEVSSVKALKHWVTVKNPRYPWTPEAVAEEIAGWLVEIKHSEALLDAGERLMPLLLCGETRCGKTSSLCGLAYALGMEVRRMSLADASGSYLGETPKAIRASFLEAKEHPDAMYLVDEIDGISHKRTGGQSSAQERATAVDVLLTELESLPASMMFSATTNTAEFMDPAVKARFHVVEFPAWNDLAPTERMQFAASHGLEEAALSAKTYADVVKAARKHRVAAVIAKAPRTGAMVAPTAQAKQEGLFAE